MKRIVQFTKEAWSIVPGLIIAVGVIIVDTVVCLILFKFHQPETLAGLLIGFMVWMGIIFVSIQLGSLYDTSH